MTVYKCGLKKTMEYVTGCLTPGLQSINFVLFKVARLEI